MQVAGARAHDEHRPSVPRVFVHRREIDLESFQLGDGALHRLGVDVEAKHHQRVHERRGLAQRVVRERVLRVVREQRAVPGVARLEVDPQPAGDRRVFPPHRVLGGAVGMGSCVLLHERERPVPVTRVAVVHLSEQLAAAARRTGSGEQGDERDEHGVHDGSFQGCRR